MAIRSRFLPLPALLVAALVLGPGRTAIGADAPATGASLASSEANLTPEERAEREGRRACKAAMCAAFRNPDNVQNVACDITKSLRKEQLQKIVSKAKVSWPWGKVVCMSAIKADRATLAKALSADKLTVKFEQHKVACKVEREKDEPADITAEMPPEVTFEKGKAVKTVLNWGKVEGPTMVKGLMWTATATDNTVNVLGSMVTDDLNDFVTKKCDEVKSDWDGK